MLEKDSHYHALQPGTMIGHFRIERRLGKKGGFGFTYLATDMKLKRPVALKELFPNEMVVRRGTSVVPISNDRETISMWNWALRKFKEEARHLARFRHPNIVVVSDLIEENHTAYIVMHYVEGRSFDQVLRETGHPVKESLLLHVLNGVWDGLEAVHAKGILHRDIKPNNIYLTRRGGVILLDFGAARPQIRNNNRGTTFGVYADGYSPFEQYSSLPHLTPATDIYAVAATMVRAISGERPMNSSERAMADPYIPLSARYQGLYSPALLRAIDAGMAFRVEQRPQSIAEWRKMLYQGSRSSRKGRWPVALGIAAFVLLVAALSVAWALARMNSGENEEAPRMVEEREAVPAIRNPITEVVSAAPTQAPGDPRYIAVPVTGDAPGSEPPPIPPPAKDPAERERELNAFVKADAEEGVRARNYAATVTVNLTGNSRDERTVTREVLETDETREHASYSTRATRHLGSKCVSHDTATDVAVVRQAFTYDRVAKIGNVREVGLVFRELTIGSASGPGRAILRALTTARAEGYVCRLSREDHAGIAAAETSGGKKAVVRAILHKDRENLAEGRGADAEDMDFLLFHDEAARRKLTTISDDHTTLFPDTDQAAARILDETPLVEVFPDMNSPAVIIVVKP